MPLDAEKLRETLPPSPAALRRELKALVEEKRARALVQPVENPWKIHGKPMENLWKTVENFWKPLGKIVFFSFHRI